MTGELRERVRNKEGIREGGMAERSGRERGRLDDDRGHREEVGVSVEGERNGAELGSKREPSNSTVRQEEMAASASGGVGRKARISDGESRRRPESNRKVGDKGMKGIRSGGSGKRGSSGGGNKNRGRRRRSVGGEAFQRVRMGRENSRVVNSRSSSMVSKVELEGNFEMLGDKRVVKAGEAIDVSHHARWTVKDLKKVAKKFLGPAADLVDGPSHSKISLIALQSQSQKNSEPQRNLRF